MEIIELATPILVFLLMFIIGASIDRKDLANIAQQKKTLLTITFGQILLLPFSAFVLITLFQPPSLVAQGMLLISICPGGAISNIYTFMAKGNIAYSVTLTALNGLLSVIVLPLLVFTALPSLSSSDLPLDNLVINQALQLVLLLFCPVLLGLLLKSKKSHWLEKIMPSFEKLGAIGLLCLLVSVFIKFQDKILEQLSSLVLLALIFSFSSLFIAFCLCKFLNISAENRSAVIIEFPVRNLALAALIAINVFQNSDYLLFSAVFFVIQTPIMLGIIICYRIKALNSSLAKA